MIPIPPTTSEKLAMPTMMKLNMLVQPLGVAQDLDRRLDLEVVASRRAPMLDDVLGDAGERSTSSMSLGLQPDLASARSSCARASRPACWMIVSPNVALRQREREVDVLVEVALHHRRAFASRRAGRSARARRRPSARPMPCPRVPTRIVSPIGSWNGNSCWATRCPSTQTASPRSYWSCVKYSPAVEAEVDDVEELRRRADRVGAAARTSPRMTCCSVSRSGTIVSMPGSVSSRSRSVRFRP